MAPLPSGEILITEKVRGLSLVAINGKQSPLVTNTPAVWEEIVKIRGSYVGLGMMLDVVLHPDYANNGWIYLSHTDRCQLDRNSLVPQTMLRVVRGKIDAGSWHSEEVIWSVSTDFYTVIPDNVVAGRLAFDQAGHLYVTVGGKSTYSQLHVLDTPYGKIHRVNDDGSVPRTILLLPPEDRAEPTTRHTVWSLDTAQLRAWHPIHKAVRSGLLKWDRVAGMRSTASLKGVTMAGHCIPKAWTTMANPSPLAKN